MPNKITHLISVAGLVLAMVLWASSFVALKIAFGVYHPMVVLFGRMVVASICFLVLFIWFRHLVRYTKGDYKYLLFMALCEPCLYFLFEAKALENTTASQAGMITALLPVLVALAAAWLLKERVAFKTWMGSFMAVAGVCWLTLASVPTGDAPDPVKGNFFEFLAMACATGYTVTLKHLTHRYSAFFLTAVQAFGGSVFFFPFLLLPSTRLPHHFEVEAGLSILYLGVAITLGAYGLYNFGLKHIPVNKACAYVNLIPVFSVMMGWMMLGESFSMQQCLAASLVMAGVCVSQRRGGIIPQRRSNRSSVTGAGCPPGAVAGSNTDLMDTPY
jgi:drug/metabolite transporter (DMT)-like permease